MIRLYFQLIFLLGLLLCQSASPLLAQSGLVNEDFRNTDLKLALESLESKYGISIAYDPLVVSEQKINLKIKDRSITEAVELLLEDTSLEYQFDAAGNVLIRRKRFGNRGLQASVQSKDDQSPVISAAVVLMPSQLGTYTDSNGDFVFSASELEGTEEIWIQYLGYKTKKIALAEFDNASTEIDLEPSDLKLSTVTICAKLPSIQTAEIGERHMINPRVLDRLPHFGNGVDLLRTLQLLPGINNTDDLSSGLEIRGSKSSESLYLLDGIRLYKTDHFFGIFSNINEKVIGDMQLYLNAFPAQYGGKTAGVLAMSGKAHQPTKVNAEIDISFLSTSVALHTPVGNKMNLSLGLRSSNGNVGNNGFYQLLKEQEAEINQAKDDDNNGPDVSLYAQKPNFKFGDQNLKWTWQISKQNKISIAGFRSIDDFSNDFVYEIERPGPSSGPPLLQSFMETYDWSNEGLSLQHEYQSQGSYTSNLTLAHSSFDQKQLLESELKGPGLPEQGTQFEDRYNGSLSSLEMNWKNSFKLGEASQFSIGSNLLRYHSKLSLYQGQDSKLSQDLILSEISLYSQLNLQVSKDLEMQLGLRGTAIGRRSKICVSPRLLLEYSFSDHLKGKTSFGRYYQALRQLYYEDRFGRSMDFWVLFDQEGLPLLTSNNWMVGAEYKKGKYLIDVEIYQKDIDGVVEFAQSKPGPNNGGGSNNSDNELRIFEGTALYKGMDVLLYREGTHLSNWISYSLSKNENRFRQIDKNNPFPAQNDRRHQLKFVNMLEHKDWQFSASFVYASGRPYSDLSKLDGERREDLNRDDRIKRLPAYHRLDIGIERVFDFDKFSLSLNLSVFNLLDHNNVKYVQFISTIPKEDNGGNNNPPKHEVLGTEVNMLGRTPNLTLGLRF